MNPGYAVIGIYPPGKDKPQLMSANGRVLIYDTPEIAKQVLPMLGNGRRALLSADGERVSFIPIDPKSVNRAVVLTGYDPYNLPAGMGFRSEARLQEWRRHIMWSYVFFDRGQMVRRADGTYANAAIGQE